MANLDIPVTKTGKFIKVDTDLDLTNDDSFRMIVFEGLKVLINKGLSGEKYRTKDLSEEDLAKAYDAIMAKAQENFKAIKEGTMKQGRQPAATKVAGPVMTEARRLAKEVIKDEIKAAGMKVSHVAATDITKAANALIESDPSFIEMAKANIEARNAKIVVAEGADVKAAALAKLQALGGISESPKLVAKAAEEKAKAKSTLSAKQAAKVAPRKPQAQANA